MAGPNVWKVLGAVLLLSSVAAAQPPPLAEPFREELLSELRSAPLDDDARQRHVEMMFLQAGAPAEEIRLCPVRDAAGRALPIPNVEVVLEGETDRAIVIGAHFDKVEPGHGVVDDWSGICVMTNLYQELKDAGYLPRHSLVFVGFAYEEDGLLGSRAYVQQLFSEDRQIAAMVNFECFGVGDPFIWTNGSDDKLESLAWHVAETSGLPLQGHHLSGVGADSDPFNEKGVPAITFDGLPETHFGVIHSDRDKMQSVDRVALFNAYRLMYEFVKALDSALDEGTAAFDGVSQEEAPSFHPRSPDRQVAQYESNDLALPHEAVQQIGEQNRRWEESFNQGDALRIADIYASDAVILPEGRRHLSGTSAIRRYYFDFLGSSARPRDVQLWTDHIQVRKDTAYEYGGYSLTLTVEGREVVERGTTFVVWQAVAPGDWRMYWDAWYSDSTEPGIADPER